MSLPLVKYWSATASCDHRLLDRDSLWSRPLLTALRPLRAPLVVYDAVGDADGNVYMVGYTQSAVIDWGGTLQTKIIEEGENQNDDAVSDMQP